MNYAEDRLDRRARYGKENTNDTGSKPNLSGSPSRLSPLDADLNEAHRLLRSENATFKANGHELAGRTLRDCGKNRQALYHYSQAWIHIHHLQRCNLEERIGNDRKQDCHASNFTFNLSDEEKAVGDYAQMAEFNGVPEIGVVALLFYFNGGILSQDDVHNVYPTADADIIDNNVVNASNKDATTIDAHDKHFNFDCHEKVDQQSLFLPGSIISSPITHDIINSFEELNKSMTKIQVTNHTTDILDNFDDKQNNNINFISANVILDQIAKQNLAKKQAKKNTHTHGQKQRRNTGDSSSTSDTTSSTPCKTTIPISNLLHFWDPSSKTQKALSPLLQILLLKLLYVNPLGGPFLYLAIEALYHLSMTTMPLDSSSSDLSKYMAKHYKSHWAYYVLIYKIVFGERIKKHRIQSRNIPYHVPVWDIVHGLDERNFILSSENNNASSSRPQNQPLVTEIPIAPIINKLIANFTSKDYSSLESAIYLITVPRAIGRIFPPIYALGDSHVLSIGWQTIRISMKDSTLLNDEKIKYRTIIPFPVTGLKAWHTRPSTKFFTYSNLRSNLNRLPPHCKSIILSTGEIDCREGIGGTLLQGFNQSCDDAVHNTVREYISAIHDIAEEFQIQILVLPVAPHAKRSEKNGKSKGRAMRRERMVLWNDLLRSMLREERMKNLERRRKDRVFLLDYEEKLRFHDQSSPVGFVLNPLYNADYTHMNSAFLPHLEASTQQSYCNLSLI